MSSLPPILDIRAKIGRANKQLEELTAALEPFTRARTHPVRQKEEAKGNKLVPVWRVQISGHLDKTYCAVVAEIFSIICVAPWIMRSWLLTHHSKGRGSCSQSLNMMSGKRFLDAEVRQAKQGRYKKKSLFQGLYPAHSSRGQGNHL